MMRGRWGLFFWAALAGGANAADEAALSNPNLGKYYGSIRFALSVDQALDPDGMRRTYAGAKIERGRFGITFGTTYPGLNESQGAIGHVPGETDAERSLKNQEIRRNARDRILGGSDGWHPDLGFIKVGAYLKERSGKILFESDTHCRKLAKPMNGYECMYYMSIRSTLW